jgi:glutamine amidotransferase PdxT
VCSSDLAASFHPELTEELGVHRYFLDMVYGKETDET